MIFILRFSNGIHVTNIHTMSAHNKWVMSAIAASFLCSFFAPIAAAAAALGSLNKNVCEQWQYETDKIAEQCPIKALHFSLLKSSYSMQRIQTHTHTKNLPVGRESKGGAAWCCLFQTLPVTKPLVSPIHVISSGV